VPSARADARSFASLAALLVLPTAAVLRILPRTDMWPVVGYLVLISALTFSLYGSDKRRAQAGEWRTPESMLHLAELAGGWAAAFAAQRYFRHKTAKRSYQAIFWRIVLIHQYAALDFMLDGRFTKPLWHLIRHPGG